MKSWKDFIVNKKLQEKGIPPVENLTLFFKVGKEKFVATEESRIMFAKIKTKDTKDTIKNKQNFIAYNIKNGKKQIFEKKDINNIEVCEKEEIINVSI